MDMPIRNESGLLTALVVTRGSHLLFVFPVLVLVIDNFVRTFQ